MMSNVEKRGNRFSLIIWGGAALLWSAPLIAMQFTHEVAWSVSDFAVFGLLLALTAGAIDMTLWMTGNIAYRLAAGIAVLAGFLLVWINLAVGMIGGDNNPANLMFGGVLAIGLIAALIARFQARGMAVALIMTALAQIAVGLFAYATGQVSGMGPTAVLTAIFAGLWLASAALFRKAAQ